jgi:putative transposase
MVDNAKEISEVLGVKPEEVWAEGKYRRIVEARSLLCYWAVRELGVPMSSLARKLGKSIPSVSESVTLAGGLQRKEGASCRKPKN